MIKKVSIALLIAVTAFLNFSCSESQSSLTERIAEAFRNNKPELAERLCNSLYDNMQTCTVETLGNLTVSYYTLSVINSTRSRENDTYKAMAHMVDCYESAMKKNPTAAKAFWIKIADESMNHGQSIDIPLIADSFRTQLHLRDILGENTVED